jgi:hypothetical protein
MPKRWERDLRRLGDVPVPTERINARAARPSDAHAGASMPPTRQRVVAGIVAFGVFIAAGTLLVRAVGPGSVDEPGRSPAAVEPASEPSLPSERDVVTVALVGDPPSIQLSYGDTRVGPLTTDIIDDRVLVPIPVNTSVRVESGAAVSWTADLLDPRRDNALGSGVPRLPVFEGTALWSWKFILADGSRVAGMFGIDLVPATTGEPSEVLRVSCEEGRTNVLTPVVAAGRDGVEVEVLPLGGEHRVQFREDEDPSSSFGGSIPADGETHPWPVAPGPAEVSCGQRSWDAAGEPFEVVDPAGHWADVVVSCAGAVPSEVVGYDGGAAEWVDEPAAIQGILRGVLRDDRIMRPLYGRDRLDRWVIVRDGDVVAVLNYFPVTDVTDPRGGGLGRVTGDACPSSGIAGTVPPRDPDEDGVELDCRAESQVAFLDSSDATVFGSAEALIRGVVSGIRETDVLVPPQSPTGPNREEGIWTVEREGKTVASIVYPELDGITCRFNAIGVPESG